MVKDRHESGLSSLFEVKRAFGQLQATRASLPNLEAEKMAAIYRLSVLLGEPPEYLMQTMMVEQPMPNLPPVVNVGLRSDVLKRRPDINRAERELAAATADIGVAKADLFPRFFLTGAVGSSSTLAENLLTGGSGTALISSFFQWPIFDAGKINSNIDRAETDAERAKLIYEKVVLESLQDVETSLVRYIKAKDRRDNLLEATAANKQAVGMARDLYEGGEESFLTVIDSERELARIEDDYVEAETETAIHLISLFKALGGGWETLPLPQPDAARKKPQAEPGAVQAIF